MQDFVYQVKAAQDSGKDINLQDVLYALDYVTENPQHSWAEAALRVLEHWRRRKATEGTAVERARLSGAL